MNTTAQSAPPRPQVLGGPVPYLIVDGALRASQLYQHAFGAREVGQYPPDEKGRTMHVHLYVNGGSLMLCDGYPEYGHPVKEHQGYSLHLQVEDIDAWWSRAVAAGLQAVQPVKEMFWGDRWGQLRDSFGVLWSMGAPA